MPTAEALLPGQNCSCHQLRATTPFSSIVSTITLGRTLEAQAAYGPSHAVDKYILSIHASGQSSQAEPSTHTLIDLTKFGVQVELLREACCHWWLSIGRSLDETCLLYREAIC